MRQKKNNSEQCLICKAARDATIKVPFCKKHYKAYEELKKGYELWLAAYGTLTWEDYLKKLSKIDGVGSFILDVIDYELFFKTADKEKKH